MSKSFQPIFQKVFLLSLYFDAQTTQKRLGSHKRHRPVPGIEGGRDNFKSSHKLSVDDVGIETAVDDI